MNFIISKVHERFDLIRKSLVDLKRESDFPLTPRILAFVEDHVVQGAPLFHL